MLVNLTVGKRVRLDLRADLEAVIGVFEGITEDGMFKICCKDEKGALSFVYVNPLFLRWNPRQRRR